MFANNQHLWGIVTTNLSQNPLKIKINLQLSYAYIMVSYSCDFSAAISVFMYSLSSL